MSAPQWQTAEGTPNAPPVRKAKGNPIRRHWLTGAFVFALAGGISFAGLQVYQAEQRLNEVLAARAKVESELRDATQKHERLQETLQKVTSDEYMELLAKKMGFTKPNEKVYQTGSPKGN